PRPLVGPGRGPGRVRREQPAPPVETLARPHRGGARRGGRRRRRHNRAAGRPLTAHIPVDSADSPLGARATRAVAVGGPLPFTDPRHLAAHQWLVDETYLLDRQELDEWLARMTEDVHYYMPFPVTTSLGAGYDTA